MTEIDANEEERNDAAEDVNNSRDENAIAILNKRQRERRRREAARAANDIQLMII